MKILHTSDWHLGHQLYGYDRTEEQQDMLDQIVQIVSREKPDAFLLCGDVFHVPQPPVSVQKLFVNAIHNICRANPGMKIIISAGNHDSGSRHEIFRTPWSALGVDVIGTLQPENPEAHIIEVPDKGIVISVPYTHERFMPDNYFETLLQIVNQRNSKNLPVVMMAHTTVSGADFKGHELQDKSTIGGIERVDITKFGTGYDYLALGHIHHEQFVHTGHHNVRYSGSPLAVSFDEDFKHSVSMVEIEEHGQVPKIREIEINNIRPLITLPINGFTDWESVKNIFKKFPDDKKGYIRLNVEVDNFLPSDAIDTIRQIAETKNCHFCLINEKRRRDGVTGPSSSLSVTEFKEMPPIEIAKKFVEEKGGDFNEEMVSLFREVVSLLTFND